VTIARSLVALTARFDSDPLVVRAYCRRSSRARTMVGLRMVQGPWPQPVLPDLSDTGYYTRKEGAVRGANRSSLTEL